MDSTENYDTLSGAINALNKDGYSESFIAGPDHFEATVNKRTYKPEELQIDESFRFEGITNPSDQSELFAISAKDGTKGTIVMSFSAESNQNRQLIKLLKSKEEVEDQK